MLQNFIDIIAAPKTAFARIREKPTIWLPLLVFLAFTAAAQAGYLLINDEGFVKDQLIEQTINTLNATGEQADQIEEQIMAQSITTQAITTVVALLIFVPVILALQAWYLSFMSKFSFSQLGFRHWFSLQCWTSFPACFAALASLVVLLTDANGQVSQSEMQPLGIYGLLGISTDSATLQQLNLTHIWSLVLLALGYQQWTQKSLLTSILITWAPTVLIYGGVIFFNM
jgi:hypothetical protein